MPVDTASVRRQFPLLSEHDIAYFDSASTCQKPEAVIRAMERFMTETNANVNRGVYPLAEAATNVYENARATVAGFIGAKSREIVFTKNATEAINLVARTLGGGNVLLSVLEHHSNIVPWQQMTEREGGSIAWIDLTDEGVPDLAATEKSLKTHKIALVATTGLSNVLGSLPDLSATITLAHRHGAKVLIDASQLAAHERIDVRALDCDFLVFSGHKIYGPTGIGVLYGKAEILESLPPFLGGGDMIGSVTKEGFRPAELPRKFEAGTMPAAEAAGLTAAIEWMDALGPAEVHAHTSALTAHALSALRSIPELTVLGPTDQKLRKGCVSFVVKGVHPHDLTDVLGQKGFCLRAGHHCTEPLHASLDINASARMSFGVHNTTEEIDGCVRAMEEAIKFLRKN